jgi:23S rRNA pseudouridine2605 synthase
MMIRLNKFLSESGITSRRKSEEYISQGRVTINDKVITDLSARVDLDEDIVKLDGEKLHRKKHVYILLNKPKGTVTTTSDEKKRKTVIDYIKSSERVYPVGRLDYNTTGVLLLTNDGEFSNLLTHPKNHVPREYEIKLDRALKPEDKYKLLKGVFLNGKKGKFESLNFLREKDFTSMKVLCVEGRNHFVKNMFGVLGYKVISLNRKSFAGLKTDMLPGKYRFLSYAEVNKITGLYGNKN